MWCSTNLKYRSLFFPENRRKTEREKKNNREKETERYTKRIAIEPFKTYCTLACWFDDVTCLLADLIDCRAGDGVRLFQFFQTDDQVFFSPPFKGSPFFLHLKVTPSVFVKIQVKVTSFSEQVNFTEGLETFSGGKQNVSVSKGEDTVLVWLERKRERDLPFIHSLKD
jgi:hypothetical protein